VFDGLYFVFFYGLLAERVNVQHLRLQNFVLGIEFALPALEAADFFP
jgi:hypothetical protein